MSDVGVIVFVMLLVLVLAVVALWMDVREMCGGGPDRGGPRGFDVVRKDEG